MSQQFDQLKTLLKELFQLDQPDLDFGLYRIMHAKANEVTHFLEHELLPQVREAFQEYRTADKAELEKQLSQAVEQAQGLGVDPESTDKVQELRRKLADEAVDIDALEADVYDHLYRFFRRYYHEGDFIPKRVYKPGVYAIPYEGEEVKLHWANRDQYYIKSSEYLRHYTFKLKPHDEENPMRVHFKLVDAAEGEHGNNKESNGDRVFILAGDHFIGDENGELVVRFEYRQATMNDWPEDAKKEATAAAAKKPPAKKVLLADAVKRILNVNAEELRPWILELAKKAPTEDHPERTVAEKHVNKYSDVNTFDYFIHKDLGGFLRQELDFYIKNEVMHLDDVESDSAHRVEQYLSKIRVIRRIAHKIIAFLAQLEEFEKKLWLKKKFVVAPNYCIRIDCIPPQYYPQIADCDNQWSEWCQLYNLEDSEYSLYASDATRRRNQRVAFLEQNPTLVMDTQHFSTDFTQLLIDSFDNLQDMLGGLLVHGENFQALNLLQSAYRGQIKSIYIDPPYNTGNDEFLYKDNYQHSSWISMMSDRLALARNLQREDGAIFISVDDNEQARLNLLMDELYSPTNFLANIIWEKVHTRKNSAQFFSTSHDYLLAFAKHKISWDRILLPREDTSGYSNPDNDPKGPWKLDPVYANNPYDADYKITKPNGVVLTPPSGQYWRFSEETWNRKVEQGAVLWGEGNAYPMVKRYLSEVQDGLVPVTLFKRDFAGDNGSANQELKNRFGESRNISYPKPSQLIQRVYQITTRPSRGENILDFFAGSGTAVEATIALNRQDDGRRGFVAVEMDQAFDDLLLPRVKKVMFAPEWRDGVPSRQAGDKEIRATPKLVKYVRMESYEDTLNNLTAERSEPQQSLLESVNAQGQEGLKEQYMLRYMLDVETRDSQSLLNIDGFTDPTAYTLKLKQLGSEESRETSVDLVETFNYLIGLAVEHIAAPQTFSAEFQRDSEGRLRVKGDRVKPDKTGPWWFRTVTGVTPDGKRTLVIWRKMTGDAEQDNLVLDHWFTKQGYSTKDYEFHLIYVNGDNNLENLRQPDDAWKVRLIEEDFHRLMFDGDDV